MFSATDVGMWHAGVDYVRLTTRPQYDDGETEGLYRKCARAVVAAGAEGAIEFEPWRWLGYYGERCASVAYGAGPQGCILQVAGWQAQDEALLGAPWDGVPRLDVQLTVWLTRDVPGVAAEVARRSRAASHFARGGRWKVAHIDGGDDGATAYIGSRASDSFIRCYDKWRESGRSDDYTYAWRFECEFKNEQAASIWPEKGTTTHDPDVWAQIVLSRLSAKGIVLPGVRAARRNTTPPAPRPKTTAESRLAWLRTQVAPTIDKLLAAGVSLRHVEEALGLTGTDRRER